VVAVDKTRLQQALGNLIDNALTHTDDGGHIQVSASLSPDRELTMSVADTGSGFPAAFIDKAFDPFARADAGRSEGGTGLGLAIVKAIVTAHGGSIEATNQDRSGALLTMKVPAGA
jgi:signal transduction histidine kinase